MGGAQIIWKIGVLVTAIAIIILTIPYWIDLDYYNREQDWVWVALDIVSAVLMIILGIIGIVGALKLGRLLLLIYIIGMLCLFVFILIQLIVNSVIYGSCDGSVAFVFSCTYGLAQYLVPTILMFVITILGGIFGILLRKQIVADEKPAGNYY